MKVAVINKSDATGGAAVVSFRLMEALRAEGVDARMIVTEKLTDSPYVSVAAPSWRMKIPFLKERLGIFLKNGFSRDTLFKIDTASDGLPLHKNPIVRYADVICLNWVNQGMLSLKGLRRLLGLGKPVFWTMHDMWCITGICHHAGKCLRYRGECGECPLLGPKSGPKDMSRKTLLGKKRSYSRGRLEFVAVSNWLAGLARKSTLLADLPLHVIPNAFPFPGGPDDACDMSSACVRGNDRELRIMFGAARLDDPVKGLPVLVEATRILADEHPEAASRLRLVTFGNMRDPEALKGVAIAHTHLGRLNGADAVRAAYESGDMVVSTSLYETLPGTLVEGLAYGCVPVSFNRGGQSDIVDHLSTGYIAEWNDSLHTAAENIVKGILWAADAVKGDPALLPRMYNSAWSRFNSGAVARRYIDLFKKALEA